MSGNGAAGPTTIHLIINEATGKAFAVYINGRLARQLPQPHALTLDDLLSALGVITHQIFFDEGDMANLTILPATFDAVVIDKIRLQDDPDFDWPMS